MAASLLSGLLERHARVFVLAGAHGALLENIALGDPVERGLEHLARIRLEYDALARAPAARIHLVEEACRELLPVVVRVELRPQVDVALRALQGAEILLHVLRI